MYVRIFAAALALAPICLYAQVAPSTLSLEQKESFLQNAKVQQRKGVNKGITGTTKVTLSDGTLTHDASVQEIDEYKALFRPKGGGKEEREFKDSYKFNVAAYILAKKIGLGDMVPPSVERSQSAYTWWIDDVLMEEGERLTKRAAAPNEPAWAREMALVRVFDQLIANTDRNGGNLIIDKNWNVWMIDHTRSFRTNKEPTAVASLTLIDRGVLAKLKMLEEDSLRKDFGRLLTRTEIRALLARRDRIVAVFEDRGPAGLFDRPAR